MALAKRTVTLPVAIGIDERSDPKSSDPSAKLSALSSADLSERGAIKKRRPYVQDTTGQWPLNDPSRNLVIDSQFLGILQSGGESSTQAHLGAQCQLSRKLLTADTTQRHELSYSCLGYDGSVYVAYSIYRGSSPGYTWRVSRYTADGVALAEFVATSPGASTSGKLLAWESGGSHGVWLFYLDGTQLKAEAFDHTGTSASSVKTILSPTAASAPWDVSQQEGQFATGYVSVIVSGGTTLRTYTFDLTELVSAPHSTLTNHTVANVSSVSVQVADDGDAMVASWSTSAGVEIWNSTDATTSTVTATPTSGVTEFALGRALSNDVLLAFTWDDGTNGPACYIYRLDTDTSTDDSNVVYGFVNVARPVLLEPGGPASDHSYVLLQREAADADGTEEQKRYVLAEFGGVSGVTNEVWPVAVFALDESYVPFAVDHPPQIISADADTLIYPGAILTRFQDFNGTLKVVEGIAMWKFDFRKRVNYSVASIAGLTVIAGASPNFYDGRGVQMLGHPVPPSIASAAVSAGGGLTGSVDYDYRAVYEFFDARGNVWRSAPSNIVTITTDGTNKTADIDVWVGANHVQGGGKYEINIALYRNTQAAPTTFYRVSDPFDATDSGTYAEDWNASGAYVTFQDSASDTTIASNELLYTTGGVVDNAAMPPLRCVAEHRNRLWGVHAETGDIWATKEYVPGEGLHFSLNHVVSNPVPGDVANALVSTESSLVVIYGSRIGQIFGDGPNDLGQGQWSRIEFLPGDKYGTYSPHTAEPTPYGIVMVDRDVGPVMMPYGGYPQRIADDLAIATYDEDSIISVDYLEDRDEVRFNQRAGTYRAWWPANGAWGDGYTGAHYDGGSTSLDLTAVWQGRHVVGRDGGTVVYVEDADAGTYAGERNSAPPQLLATTSWIKLADLPGIQGQFRLWDVYLIGEYVSPHVLGVLIYYDFDEGNFEVKTVSAANLLALDLYQLRFRPNQQRCKAVRISVIDATTTSWQEGFKLSQIRLDFGVQPSRKPWVAQEGQDA